MRGLLIPLIHLIVTAARLLGGGGGRAIVAENLLLKQQLLVLNRTRQRAPRLTATDRTVFGVLSLFLTTRRLVRAAIVLKPSTLLRFHRVLVKRKYHELFTPHGRSKPGPKGPSEELIRAIVEIKQRNPGFGCPRIAQQIAYTFGVELNKDVVRRVLERHYHPGVGGNNGPFWLTVIGHAKDSLWSVDLFRCESLRLQTHWVLMVMDQFTRRLVGFAVQVGAVDGRALCRSFNRAISRQGTPQYLSSDNDPLFEYHPWQANLRILDVEEIKTVPYAPISHPFVERLIGTVRREFLDRIFFWNTPIFNVNSIASKRITILSVFMRRSVASHRQRCTQAKVHHCPIIDGDVVAMDSMNCPLPCDRSFAVNVADLPIAQDNCYAN